MPPWRTAVGVGAGATVTVLGTVPSAAVLPVVGALTGEFVGNWLPTWLFVLPLLVWPVVGGGVAAAVGRRRSLPSLAIGGLAGGLGTTVLGTVAGLLFFVLVAGMTPAHGQPMDFARLSREMGLAGAIGGFLVGGCLGAVGGAGVAVLRTAWRETNGEN